MNPTLAQAFARGFLGQSPDWYKLTIVGFLVANPILMVLSGPVVTGWVVLAEMPGHEIVMGAVRSRRS